MSTYRYDIETIPERELRGDPRRMADVLNQRGRDGWELVATEHADGVVTLIMKLRTPSW